MQKFFQSLFRFPPPPAPAVLEAIREVEVPGFDLVSCWRSVRLEYFPDLPEIDRYEIRWSKRARSRMLACCDTKKQVVRVAAILNKPECFWLLPALLYHEMCHSVLGPPVIRRGRRVIHGAEFKALEKRHPGIKALDEWIRLGGWREVVISAKRTRIKTAPRKISKKSSRKRRRRVWIRRW